MCVVFIAVGCNVDSASASASEFWFLYYNILHLFWSSVDVSGGYLC